MLLEQRVVSRKTQADGKLEVSPQTAARLASLGRALMVDAGGERAHADIGTMLCTCAKRSGERHVHYFVASPLLRTLPSNIEVLLQLDVASATVCIEPVSVWARG